MIQMSCVFDRKIPSWWPLSLMNRWHLPGFFICRHRWENCCRTRPTILLLRALCQMSQTTLPKVNWWSVRLPDHLDCTSFSSISTPDKPEKVGTMSMLMFSSKRISWEMKILAAFSEIHLPLVFFPDKGNFNVIQVYSMSTHAFSISLPTRGLPRLVRIQGLEMKRCNHPPFFAEPTPSFSCCSFRFERRKSKILPWGISVSNCISSTLPITLSTKLWSTFWADQKFLRQLFPDRSQPFHDDPAKFYPRFPKGYASHGASS